MTEQSLSKLFRQLSAQQRSGAADLLDADTLVAASAGTLRGDRRDEVASRLSRSPVQTDLVRMLGELAPASAELAAVVGERHVHEHSRGSRRLRHGSSERRVGHAVRWVGMAACLMLVVGAVFWLPQGGDSRSGTAQSEVRPDRIFTSKDRIFAMVEPGTVSSATDGVFQSDFNGG
ncbi:hypothetical protein [Dokdonella sp.]|uniref:hypothetical protein n=1 Tax=Dokdonella sp. TaxID=2291710 RepID=UPI003C4E0580